MVHKHLKRNPSSLVLREINLKPQWDIISHPPQTGIKKLSINTRWRDSGVTGIVIHCWWKCKLLQPRWEPVCYCLIKLSRLLPYGPSILLVRCRSWGNSCTCARGTYTRMFIATSFRTAPNWKSPKWHINDRMVKWW